MASAPPVQRSLVANWHMVLKTCSLPPGREVDPISRWLIVTRACVQPMTLVSVAIGGLLAARAPAFDAALFALAGAGLVLAHAANNMINDYFDLESGLDTAAYPRALYAPHPVMTGLIDRSALVRAILVVNVLDALIMIVLASIQGWRVIGFAVAGLVISAGYVAPPLRLKARGLGEPGVLIVWGPLMIGGIYYSATGTIPSEVLTASMPYGLLVMSVLMGKHIDKAPWDAPLGYRTLPVRLGDARARTLTLALMVAFYVAVGVLVVMGLLTTWSLLVVGALPQLVRAWRAFTSPKPTEAPPDYPVWPLWFVSWAFLHSRRAGALLVLGLAMGAILPTHHL